MGAAMMILSHIREYGWTIPEAVERLTANQPYKFTSKAILTTCGYMWQAAILSGIGCDIEESTFASFTVQQRRKLAGDAIQQMPAN